MSNENIPAFIVEAQAREEIGRRLAAHAPAGWKQLQFKIESVGGLASTSSYVQMPNQEPTQLDTPGDVILSAHRLRVAMYEEDKGTWFSAVFTVLSSGSVSAEYNYDAEPGFEGIPVVAGVWTEEQEKFPRSPENQPAWLKAKHHGH